MRTCPYCATENREGVFFCEECGHPFLGSQEMLATTRLSPEDRPEIHGRVTWGTARFDLDASIVIRVRDFAEPINLRAKEEILLGRSDFQSTAGVDLDMAPFGAAEQGVSRRHAIIRRGENTLTLEDLGSTNGTHLNGQRLIPNQPRVLRDGDEIRMGRLVFHIFFK
jgi:pSer/pThr/pTyr-binding forkhead associated (FHA) protein